MIIRKIAPALLERSQSLGAHRGKIIRQIGFICFDIDLTLYEMLRCCLIFYDALLPDFENLIFALTNAFDEAGSFATSSTSKNICKSIKS